MEPTPLRRLVMWSPITAFVFVAVQVVMDILTGFTVARVVGLCVGAVWLGLAIYNWRTGGAFVRGLYASDDEPTARAIEPDERKKP